MLAGRALELADLERSMVYPMSNAEGRWPSRDGRDDAGDLGMLRLDMWDLDLESRDGLAGSANSDGFIDGLLCDFSNVLG
jgi:hypothetical protein